MELKAVSVGDKRVAVRSSPMDYVVESVCAPGINKLEVVRTSE